MTCICLSKKDILIQDNRCGATEKVAKVQPPWSFGFMPLPFVALRSVATVAFQGSVFFLTSLLVAILPWSKLGTGGIVVVGWRR